MIELDDPARLSRMIGRVYDCVLHPDRWSATLRAIGETIGAQRGALAVAVVGSPRGRLMATYGLEDFTPAVMERMNPLNPVLPIGLVWPFDRAYVVSRDYGLERYQATRFHRELTGPRGDLDTIAFMLTREGHAIGHWTLITPVSRGPIEPAEIAALERLAPHVRRAVDISNVLGARTLEADTYRAVLGELDATVMVVDAERRIVYANPRADSMLEAGDPLRVRDGRLRATGDANERALREAIEDGDEATHPPGAREAMLRSSDGTERMMFSVPIGDGPDTPFGTRSRITLLVLRSPREDTRNPITIAAREFGLTPMQVQVLAFLVQGHAPEAIADLLGVGVATVRTHLAELFRRSGTARQAELVARTMSLASPLRVDR